MPYLTTVAWVWNLVSGDKGIKKEQTDMKRKRARFRLYILRATPTTETTENFRLHIIRATDWLVLAGGLCRLQSQFINIQKEEAGVASFSTH